VTLTGHATVLLVQDILHPPVQQGYGMYELRVRDPDGYVLAFGRRA
jgi:hypothetical protein